MWVKGYQNHMKGAQVKIQQKQRQYPSKLLSELMNSDSQDEYIEQDKQTKYTQQTFKEPPPHKKQSIKQNISYDSNKLINQIKYSCYKIHGQKLNEIGSGLQYNSLNLQQTSIIRDSNQQMLQQYEKIKQDLAQEKSKLNNRIIQLESANKALQRQLNFVQDKLKTKQICYDKQVEGLHKKVQQLQNQINQLHQKKQDYKTTQTSNIKRQKRQGQLSRFLSGLYKQQNFQSQPKKQQQNSQRVYKEVKTYLTTRIEEFKNKLMEQRMSKQVEQIIEQFMAQVININSITVSRVVNKSKLQHTPIINRNLFKTQQDQQVSNFTKSGLFRESRCSEIVAPAKTPPKIAKRQRDFNQKQKPNQLRQLEKSLTKLRQMENQYVSKKGPIPKDSYQSLDRSSILGLDKSSRSKSRRKKIFQ